MGIKIRNDEVSILTVVLFFMLINFSKNIFLGIQIYMEAALSKRTEGIYSADDNESP